MSDNKEFRATGQKSDSSHLLTDDEKQIQSALHAHLNKQVDDLDYNVSVKLSAARRRALSQKDADSPVYSNSQWLNRSTMFGGATAVALVVFAGVKLYPQLSDPQLNGGVLDSANQLAQTQLDSNQLIQNLSLLSASDDIDFYQSIEFLEWMESEAS